MAEKDTQRKRQMAVRDVVERNITEKELTEKRAITKPILQSVIIMLAFYVIEIIMVYIDLFPDYNMLLCADIVLRMLFGTVSLILIKSPRKPLFTNKITAKTWLVMIPFLIYVSLPVVKIFFADVYAAQNLVPMIIVVIQQFATGYYEEARDRGLLMDGLLKYKTATVKDRLFTVMVSGLIFGFSHLPNIFFGENPLIQVPAAALWGLFMAAVYMLSDNLLLVMMLHAVSDITPKVARGMFGWTTEPAVLQILEYASKILDYVVLPLVAVYICVKYDELKRSGETADYSDKKN